MPPKLRVLDHNSRLEQRLESEISNSLAKVLRTNANMTPREAVWSIEQRMLENNPYSPPQDGKCPINDLPDEILGYIFQVGVNIQEEEEWDDYSSDEDDQWEDVSSDEDNENVEDDDSQASPSSESSLSSISSPEASDEEDDEDEYNVPFQVLVSHICRRWREVAIDSHNLWTTLNFIKYPQLEKAQLYISRAQGLPLNFVIDCTFDGEIDEEDHPDHPLYQENKELRKETSLPIEPELDDESRFLSQKELKQILDLIVPEVSHWRSLDFRASTYGYVQLLLARLHEIPAAPLLESFLVYHFEDCDDYEFFSGDDKTSYLPFHGNAPNLKEATFWGIHINWDDALTNFLKGLRELELSYHAKDVRPSYSTFTQIIKGSPELQILTLSLSGPALANDVTFDSEEGWGPEPLSVPSLKEFVLQFQDPKYASAIVQHLDLPAVRNVVLNFDEEDYSDFVRALLKPVKGRTESLPQQIDHLKISGLPCDVASVEALLSQLAQLKSLNLKVHGEEESVIFEKLIDPAAGRPPSALIDSSTAPSISKTPPSAPSHFVPLARLPKVFCPRLESITTTNVNGSLLKNLIIARRNIGAPLKNVMMSETDHITKKEEKWIRANVEELEFFVPSDSDDDDEFVPIGEDSGPSDAGSDRDDDSSVDEPLPTPLAQEIGRGRARRRQGNDLD